jgi:hypothetical protein
MRPLQPSRSAAVQPVRAVGRVERLVRRARGDEEEVAGLDGVDLLEVRAVPHRRRSLQYVDRRLVPLVQVRPGLRPRRQDEQLHAQALGPARLG